MSHAFSPTESLILHVDFTERRVIRRESPSRTREREATRRCTRTERLSEIVRTLQSFHNASILHARKEAQGQASDVDLPGILEGLAFGKVIGVLDAFRGRFGDLVVLFDRDDAVLAVQPESEISTGGRP